MRILNLGCGYDKWIGAVNVDAFESCKPDVVWDLNKVPYPWDDESFDFVYASHIFEHLQNWWEAFLECVRVLKVGGQMEIRVPHESRTDALGYRDHLHIITPISFHGTYRDNEKVLRSWTNAWALEQEGRVPMKWLNVGISPFKQYTWMTHVPGLARFVSKHFTNFIHEYIFMLEKIKISDRGE